MRDLIEWLKPGARVKRYIFTLIISVLLLIFCGINLGGTSDLTPTMLLAYVLLITLSIFGIIFSFILAQRNILLVSLKNISKRNKNIRIRQLLYGDPRLKKGPKVVVIGGGSGLPNLLKGLKEYTSNITAVVNVSADDYTLTSAMSKEERVTPGDIRKCVSALSTSESDFSKLLTYKGENGISIGNSLINALTDITGSFPKAIDKLSDIFKVQGDIYPVTTDELILCAGLENGEVVVGKENISERVRETRTAIKQIFLKDGSLKVVPEVIGAIKKANIIVLGPGSLYTSIASNLLFEEVSKAIIKSKAKKVYVANIMNQPGQTEGYTLARYINEIERYLGKHVLDYAIVNNGEITPEMIKDFNQEDSTAVKIDLENIQNRAICVIQEDFVLTAKNALIHDADRLAEIIMTLSQTKAIGDLNIVSMKRKHMQKERILTGKKFIKSKLQERKAKKIQKKIEKQSKAKKTKKEKVVKPSAKSQETINKIKDKISKE
ncbi:MAG: YvcK family protein [Clostridia bacterium]|nr:YvcK family protein [Clostridia bacterium]